MPFGPMAGGLGALGSLFQERNAFETQQAMNLRAWSQQMMQQQMAQGMFGPPMPPTRIPPAKLWWECSFCGRQTKKPDHEYGCRGCGAMEWE